MHKNYSQKYQLMADVSTKQPAYYLKTTHNVKLLNTSYLFSCILQLRGILIHQQGTNAYGRNLKSLEADNTQRP